MFNRVLIALCVLFLGLNALPWTDQVLLANSLVVGREEDLALWICATCDETNKPIHSHYVREDRREIKCVVSVYPNFIVLAFRYTANVLNLWQDLLYPFQKPDELTCKKCKVQKEYNSMWNTIRNNVTRDLLEIKNQTGIETLLITGISLGGGLAGISFIDFNYAKLFKTIKVVTFGAPRVGNKHWAAHFDQLTNSQSRRYLIKGDPIPILPECLSIFCGYRHAGIKIVCNKKTLVCEQQKETDDLNLFSRAVQTYEDLKEQTEDDDVKGIIDHIYGYKKIATYTLVINGQKVTE